MAVESQNKTPNTPPHLPCSPHACDVLRDAQPTHALRAGQSFHIPHGGLPSGTNSSSYKRRGSHGALKEVASPTRTCQSDYELLAGVDGVRKILGLRLKRAAQREWRDTRAPQRHGHRAKRHLLAEGREWRHRD